MQIKFTHDSNVCKNDRHHAPLLCGQKMPCSQDLLSVRTQAVKKIVALWHILIYGKRKECNKGQL